MRNLRRSITLCEGFYLARLEDVALSGHKGHRQSLTLCVFSVPSFSASRCRLCRNIFRLSLTLSFWVYLRVGRIPSIDPVEPLNNK
jgi:hypothetical protein